ncbi:hypothetical protein Ddye_008261 [Dipteronia dyeriana]|uniref:Retrotransposon Copia-like N-terminal domain-containing protein n=1 Tax=Dipteronia dyeriana TaxID=168575 RepID=A0AAE0CL70_9ROSI|nr:hypothetical protein Ddye_008261 [Dipteronia dyeriana]
MAIDDSSDSVNVTHYRQLSGDNYASWSRAMSIALSVKNKLGFINGSISKPEGQLLLMDPLPPINKVFALISQEENQRKIANSLSSNTELAGNMAFTTRVDSAKVNNAGQSSSSGYKMAVKDIYIPP